MREPVRILWMLIAVLTAVLGIGGLADRIPEDFVFWGNVALVALVAVGGELARQQVTPLVDPKDDRNRPLVALHTKPGTR